MPILYASGIVGAGKSEAISKTKALTQAALHKELYTVSLGKIFADAGKKLEIPESRLNYIPNEMQIALRTGVMSQCAIELLNYKPDDLVVIDGPLTLVDSVGITQETFNMSEFKILSDPPVKRPIDRRFISIIDDPRKVIARNKGTAYPTDPADILNWTVQEVEKAKQFSDYYVEKRALAVPMEYSSQLLLKTIIDPEAPIAYFAYPITSAKNRPDAKEKINNFRNKLNLCVPFVNPIELSDRSTDSVAEMTYTKYRDLHWFVRQAQYVIAYYPEEGLPSTGVPAELKEGELLAKINILIHPRKERHPFGISNILQFSNEDEFFDAIKSSRTDEKFKDLSSFLEDGSDRFRYEGLLEGIPI